MLRALTSAISGLQNFQDRLDVIGNNIANVNTTGFKAARTDLADSFSETLAVSSDGTAGTSSTTAMQIGSGVSTSSIKNIHSQGALTRTGMATDLAIAGEGYFVVRDTQSSANFATRAGDFRLDGQGYMITNTGHRLQGYSDAGLTAVGDIQVDRTGAPSTAAADAEVSSFSVDDAGRVHVQLSDGTQFVRGQVLLQSFRNPQALVKSGHNLFTGLDAAGPLGGAGSAQPAAPGTSGLGAIESGALELSNVDLANEFSSLITTQRAFQASARMISTSDEMLQELVNLKR